MNIIPYQTPRYRTYPNVTTQYHTGLDLTTEYKMSLEYKNLALIYLTKHYQALLHPAQQNLALLFEYEIHTKQYQTKPHNTTPYPARHHRTIGI